MSEIIKLEKINEVYFRVLCNVSQSLELKETLSCYAPNFQFHPRFKARIWNGKISFYDMRTKLLPIGLFDKFLDFIRKFDYKYELKKEEIEIINEIDLIHFYDEIFKDCFFSDGTKVYPRDYQHTSIFNSLKSKRGLIESPTASGKSLVIYTMIRYFLQKNIQSMIVVPNISLVEQMHSDFKEYGWKECDKLCNKLYAGQDYDKNKPCLLTTWQSIYTKPEKFFDRFGAVIVDETHGAKSNSIKSVLQKCTKSQYRIGLTGTLPTQPAEVYTIHGYLGSLLFEQKSSELIDKGILSQIIIANLLVRYPDDVVQKNKNRPYPEEVDTIINYKDRNKVLDFIFDNTPDKQNTLILCHRIQHLKDVEEYLVKKLPDKYSICLIYGEIGAQQRESIRKMMEVEENVILLGTYQTMGTGINIKRLHQIIFYESYKSKIKVLQSLGRGLRLHETKSKLILWDIVDDLRWEKKNKKFGLNHVFKHWKERIIYYKQQGFEYINKTFKI